jgi:hypothetical protein
MIMPTNTFTMGGHINTTKVIFAFATAVTVPGCVLDAPGSLIDSTVANLVGLDKLLKDDYNANGGKLS